MKKETQDWQDFKEYYWFNYDEYLTKSLANLDHHSAGYGVKSNFLELRPLFDEYSLNWKGFMDWKADGKPKVEKLEVVCECD